MRKFIGILLALVLAAFLAEMIYFGRVYSEMVTGPALLQGQSKPTSRNPPLYDLVLVYTGTSDIRLAAELAAAGNCPLFISGVVEKDPALAEARARLGRFRVYFDPLAQTTDQNARYTEPFLRRRGYHRVLLLTGWDHLPRALFLTHLYLMGSQVTLIPCANGPAPGDWRHTQRAWVQMFKFWGSLGRIVLHGVGIENWPEPEWMP